MLASKAQFRHVLPTAGQSRVLQHPIYHARVLLWFLPSAVSKDIKDLNLSTQPKSQHTWCRRAQRFWPPEIGPQRKKTDPGEIERSIVTTTLNAKGVPSEDPANPHYSTCGNWDAIDVSPPSFLRLVDFMSNTSRAWYCSNQLNPTFLAHR